MELTLKIEENSAQPMYRRVAAALREAILEGRLKPGDALPSVRDLGENLGISRLTVLRGYHDLESQGYVVTQPGSGTRVSTQLKQSLDESRRASAVPLMPPSAVPPTPFTQSVESIKQASDLDADLFPALNFGIPTADQLPIAQWRRLLVKHCQPDNHQIRNYQSDPRGHLSLRRALVSYLGRSRAVQCDPDQIFIFSGLQHALHLLGRITLQAGDAVVFENPGHIAARRVFELQQMKVIPIDVDEKGLNTTRLKLLKDPVKMVYVTPSHQLPTGGALDLSRRMELLSWARMNGTVIVENDNDSEFRYGKKPLPAFQGLDRADCVAYFQTFWKTLGPMVRMGFVIVPKRIAERYYDAKVLIEPDFPILEQCALANLIEEGILERHIVQLRKLYSRRRQILVQALTTAFGKDIQISSETAGMSALVRFDSRFDHLSVQKAALAAHFPLADTTAFYIGEARAGEFLIPFAHRADEEIGPSVERFHQSLVEQFQSRHGE